MFCNRSISRRQFLRLSALASAGLALGACAPAVRPAGSGPSATPASYYVRKQREILKDFDEMMGHVRRRAAQSHGEDLAARLVSETRERYLAFLPALPDIGGDANGLTENLYQGAAALCFYQAMRDHDQTTVETGRLLYRATEDLVAGNPMQGMNSAMAKSKLTQDKMRSAAEISHRRQYPADWVFDFVPGDGSFIYGIDYTECGICKLYQAHGAGELTPYLCLLDFPGSKATDSGLARTQTLARGGSRCDFRFRPGRPLQMEWVPDFLRSA